jgi:chromosomal replication initiator protein
VSAELEHIWSRVRGDLALAVGEPTYRIWLEPLRAVELSGDTLTVAAPPQAHRWIHDRFGRVLQASAERVLGAQAQVHLIGQDNSAASAQELPAANPRLGGPGSTRRAPSIRREPGRGAEASLDCGPLGNPKLTFDQFVIGDCNRLAHAAALTVGEMPAQAYNPLFICGPPGVGKTHLLSSIANLLLSHSPGLTVRLTTGEAFTNAFLGALGNGHTDTFKARFRDVDVLLMDDVQFLERKTRTEEEFFHTFNALYDGGRQIVLTSDRPPADLQALEDRLRERFQAGLVADIAAPDLPTRMAILRKRAQHDGLVLADDGALELIATRIQTNVRALEGALIRVVAYSSLTGRPLTSELAQEVLASLYPTASAAPGARTIADIQAGACEHFGVSSEELLSSARSPRIAWPRQVAMYLAREITQASLPTIGREFGGRDHTTVLHACRRASARIDSDAAAREAVEKLCHALGIQRP